MKSIKLNSLFTNIVNLRGYGPYYSSLFKKLCGDRYLDILLHKPSSLITRINISELDNKYIYKRIIAKGIVKSIWIKNPKIAIITIEVKNQKLSIIYFNANRKWLKNTFIKNKIILFSGELNKKGNAWQITHPDYVINNFDDKDTIPIYDNIYPLTSGLSLKKFKTALSEASKFIPKFDEWINKELLIEKDWYDLLNI